MALSERIQSFSTTGSTEGDPIKEMPVREVTGDEEYIKQRTSSNTPEVISEITTSKEMQALNDEKNGGVYNDIKTGVKRLPQNVAGGLSNLGNELWDVLHLNDAAEWIDARLPKGIKEASDALRGGKLEPDSVPFPEIEARSTTGQVIQSGTQFMVPFLGILGKVSKGTKAVGLFKNAPKMKAFFDASVAGFPVDALGFDPDEANVANVVGRVFSDNEAAQLLEEYLGTDPDDSEALNRFKNGLNGVLIGGAFEGVFRSTGKLVNFITDNIKSYRASKAFKLRGEKLAKLEKAGDAASIEKQAQKLDEAMPGAEAAKEGKPPKIADEDLAANRVIAKERIDGDIAANDFTFKWKGGKKVSKDTLDFASAAKAKPLGKPDKKIVKAIAKRLRDGEPVDLTESLGTNLDKIKGHDDLLKLIKITEEEIVKPLKKAGVSSTKSWNQTVDAVKKIGSSIEDVNILSEGTRDLDTRLLAAKLIQIDVADQTLNFMQRMSRNASPEDIVELYRRIELSAGITKQVGQAASETGRALNILRKVNEPGASTLARVDALTNILGGRKQNTLMVQRILNLAKEEGADALQLMKELEKFANRTTAGKTADAFFEMYVNGLLSRPVTQIVNTLGNASTTMMAIGERFIAEQGGRLFKSGAGGVAKGETRAMIQGLNRGIMRGWKMAAKAWKSGKPSEGFKTDMYKPGERAISADAFGKVNPTAGEGFLSGFGGGYSSTGYWLDHLGAITRVPGKFLMSGDEFFKAVNMDMERHALAFRTASDLGLQGRDFTKAYAKLISGADESLNEAAKDFSKYQTFTNELGQNTMSGKVQGVLNHDSALGFVGKIFVPFFRTPTNILKFAGHRAPLASLASKKIRDQLLRGTLAQKQLVMAKMATGSMAMSTAMYFAHGGLITGAAPKNPLQRDTVLGSGWRPYSLRTPWGYLPYNRFDPIGILLGTSADLYQTGAQIEDAFSDSEDGEELSADAWGKYLDASSIGLFSVYEQLKDRHYVAGLATVFSMIDGEPGAWKQAMRQQFKGILPPFSFYSSFVKGVTQTADPVQRDQNSDNLWTEMQNVIHKDLPPIINGGSTNLMAKRDHLGNPKLNLGGEMNMAWRAFNNIVNPAKFSAPSNSLLKNEMAKFNVARQEPWRKRTISTGIEGDPQIPIPDAAKEFYSIEVGKLNQKLQNFMKTPAYRNLPTEEAKKQKIESQMQINEDQALHMTRAKFRDIIQERTQEAKQEEALAGDLVGNVPSAVPRETLPLIPQ
jgi:hypothetical protein